MSKKTFLFIYEFLLMGGIEKALIDMIKAYSAMGMRIVWLRYGKPEDIYEPWKSVLHECNVEIIPTTINYPKWFDHASLSFDADEEVYAVAFDPMDFARLQKLAHENINHFNMFYIVPHFERDLNYVEEYYLREKDRIRIRNRLKPIYKNWYQNGNLLFFSKRHIDEMNKRYDIGCDDFTTTIYKKPAEKPVFDIEKAKKRALRSPFKIITCGRFCFPHKGYMFGLIDDFSTLKQKYPDIKLDIIGYGPEKDETKIRQYVEKLHDNVKKDIRFLGAISPDEISQYFDQASVNVSVAGGVSDGAATGIVSIPARHYVYECEVYGWLDGDPTITVCDKPGKNVKIYLEQLINMAEKEYIDVCHKSFTTVIENSHDINWLLNKRNIIQNYYSDDEIALFEEIAQYRVGKARKKELIKKYVKPCLDKLGLYNCFVGIWKRWRSSITK